MLAQVQEVGSGRFRKVGSGRPRKVPEGSGECRARVGVGLGPGGRVRKVPEGSAEFRPVLV